MLQIPVENHFLKALRQTEDMCDVMSTPLKNPLVLLVPKCSVAPVQFCYGSRMERFERFRFSVPTVPRGFLYISVQLKGWHGSGFGSWVPTVPVPVSVPGKTVLMVLVSGSCAVSVPS